MSRVFRRLSFFVALTLLALQSYAQPKTYIALGDSLAWGYQPNDVNRGPGDKGYVKVIADWLATQQGVRPTLKNLAIPGETSGSFFNTSEIGYLLNSNYPIIGRKSQAELFKTIVAQETSAGRVVSHLSYDLGGNDLLDLLTSQFLALPFAQQQAIADQALATVDSNLVTALTLIRLQVPSATIVVPGYYNPYAAFPGSPEDRISAYALPRLNQVLTARARQFNAGYAETYTGFVGRELAYTWIGENDIHPRNAGYAVIGRLAIKRLKLVTTGP